ncbi:MAG: YutD family protein [Lactobacillus crispatus]|uniref:YutD family protein n=1 Tax=Lactobacillus crispatus TaxID=47770 RepID=UPI0003161635|nr:YutD family protein [Lactobacillus crispatus]MCT7712787.1 YutD family protein [Lactobacillus crispatus]MCT7714829.1 YutD family protein [Lactobacillus crispatus]
MTEENKFEQEQPIRHPLADVVQDGKSIKIGAQLYSIIVNERDALDLESLRKKYDPYLDQYDYLVGDVSSEHLRLKGFYKDGARTAIDKKKMAIVDYLTEYCNPGGPYFILELTHPVHYYQHQRTKIRRSRERRERDFGKNERYHARRRNYRKNKNENNPFKKRRVHQTKFKKKQSIAVKKEFGRHHSFIIKKRKGN